MEQTAAGHSDVRVSLGRYTHVVPGAERGAERAAADQLDRYVGVSTVAQTVAHPSISVDSPAVSGSIEYRYRDSNPGFRRERAAS